MEIQAYTQKDLADMLQIWNEVVEAGMAFPQMEKLGMESGAAFFVEQSFTGVAVEAGQVLGLYILHPNNVGRCGHIANASYAVHATCRGKGTGEALVRHSLAMAKTLGFRIMQYNAVVRLNTPAIALYEKLGFVKLGTIPGGFYTKENTYEDIIPMYYLL